MGEGKKLISNSFYLFLDWIIASLIGFSFWFITSKFLNPTEYGILTTSINFVIILSGISLIGLNYALNKLIPEYIAKNQERKIYSLVKFSLKVILFSNLSILLFLLFFKDQISAALKIPTQVIYLVPLSILIISFCSILGSVIYGYQNMRLYMLTNFFGFLVKISLTTILLYLNFSYFGPIIGFIISYAVILFLRLFSIKIGRGESIENEKVLINFAIPAFISSLSIYVFSNSHYVFLSIFRTTLETGIFSIAMIISNIIAAFPNILAAALFPIISYLSADRRNTRKQSYLIEIVLRYASLLSLPVSIFLVVFSKEIIILFSSEKFLKSADLIPILVTASILFGLGNIFFHSLYAIGKTKIYRNLLSISSTLYILLTVLLTPKLSYIGISLSYLVSSSFLFVSSYYYIKKFLKVRLPLVDLFKISLACMIIFIPFYFFTKFFDNLLQEILFGIFSGVLYFFVLMPLRFYKKSDINILAFLEERASFGKFVFKITRKIIERSLKINGKLSVKKSR